MTISPMKNRYCARSKISETVFRKIVYYFADDLDAARIARYAKVNRNTVNRIVKQIRTRMAEICEAESPFNTGEVELDESYFGPRRVRGKRGRGAAGKTIVFGIKRRGGKVHTRIVRNCSKDEILPLIREKISTGTTVFTDGFKTYDGLVKLGYERHCRVHHGKNEFARTEGAVRSHVNGIENFWGQSKTGLAKFRGMDKNMFYLHLKECEFRCNHRGRDLYQTLLRILRENPLS